MSIPEFELDGMVVAVTGAGKGIGRAIALDAARAGAEILACSRTESDLDALRDEIEWRGGTCRTVVADVTDATDVERFLDAAPQVHAVVNNAGGNRLADALDYTIDDVDQLVTHNLRSVWLMSTAAARRMRTTGGGTILNITSQAGVIAAPGRAPYSAAKAGVNHLTKTLAVEWAPLGIRVNALAPTVTATPLGERAMGQYPALAEEVARRNLFGRPASTQEISLPAIFMLSPAAAMITGHVLVVDGGWTLT
jgi:NAD(P)-dependent dehydrogenase (short-subunit alcohol dehydrogenase family)